MRWNSLIQRMGRTLELLSRSLKKFFLNGPFSHMSSAIIVQWNSTLARRMSLIFPYQRGIHSSKMLIWKIELEDPKDQNIRKIVK